MATIECTKFDPSQTNCLYDDYEDQWLRNLAFAQMKHRTLKEGDYLPRWGAGTDKREAASQYKLRKSWSAQFDHAPELLDIRVRELWRRSPKREYEQSKYFDQIDTFLDDVDGAGTDIDSFMKRVTEMMEVNGVDVLIDKENTVTEPTSAADESGRVFAEIFGPLSRPDWSTNHAGAYEWVRYCKGEDKRYDETCDYTGIKTYVTYTADEVRVYSQDVDNNTVVVTDTHNMRQVPVVQVYWGNSLHEENNAIPTSIMSILSPLSEYMLQLSSQAQLDLFMSVAFFVMTGVQADEVPKELSASAIMAVPSETGDFKPVFSNVGHIEEKRKWLDSLSLLQLRKGKVVGLRASSEGSAQSGVQVAIEASPLHSELATTAGILERAEREIVRLAVSRMEGEPIDMNDLGYSVEYPKDFNLQSAMSLIDEMQRLSQVDGIQDVPELMRGKMRQMANHMFTPGTPEFEDAIDRINDFTGMMGDRTITETVEAE